MASASPARTRDRDSPERTGLRDGSVRQVLADPSAYISLESEAVVSNRSVVLRKINGEVFPFSSLFRFAFLIFFNFI